MKKATDKLTAKQERFVDEYLVDFNATAALARTGHKTKSPQYAGLAAHRMIKNDKVKAAIEKRKKEISERIALTQDGVVNGLWREANNYDETGQAGARVRSWELLGKYLGMFPEKINHDHTGVIKVRVIERLVELVSVLPVESQNTLLENLQSRAMIPNGTDTFLRQ